MSENLKKYVDAAMAPKAIAVIGVALGFFVAIFGGWDFIEPLTGIATLCFAASAWWQTRKAEKAHYQDNVTPDGRHVVALEVGRPVSEAVKDHFHHLDVLIRVQDIINTTVLTSDEHYETVARAVYTACARCQNKPIDLIISGPNGLAAILGQMFGLDRFRITIWQFYEGKYFAVPRPKRDWLEHR